jgi:hypothetical protein
MRCGGVQSIISVQKNELLRLVVAGFPPRRPGFDSRSGHVRFVVDKVALGKIFFELRFPLTILILPTAPYLLVIVSSPY